MTKILPTEEEVTMREEEPGAHEAQYSTPSPPPTEPMHFIVPMSHSFTVPSYDTCAAHDQPPCSEACDRP